MGKKLRNGADRYYLVPMAIRATFPVTVSSASSLNFSTSTIGMASPPCSEFSCGPNSVVISRKCFFGDIQGLRFALQERKTTWKSRRQMGARAVVKRKKDPSFDNIIQREKKLKIVSKIRDVIVKQPGRTMTLLALGKYRRDIGLTGKRRLVALLNRFPAVFEVYEEYNIKCVRFTEEAERLHDEEQKLKAETEHFLVEKLRKLLMMSVDKRLTLPKIAHLKKDLGLPEDWKTSIVPKYPQFFKEVETVDGTALELTFWDPLLAVSAAQKREAAENFQHNSDFPPPPKIVIDGEEIRPTAVGTRRLNLPKGLQLSKKDRVVALKFQQMPYQSPYEFNNLDPASMEAEKRACAAVHELLSLTLEKKTLVDHLTHFRNDYKFSQRIRAMLIRHPEMFYVSFKGHRDSVFLREAYRGSQLIDKDPLVLAKERLGELVAVPKQQKTRRRAFSGDEGTESQEEDSEFEDEEEYDSEYESEYGEEDEDLDEDLDDEEDDEEDEDEEDEVDTTMEGKPTSSEEKTDAEVRPPVSRQRPRPRPVEVEEYLSSLSGRVREKW
ncbi:hypothetical protein R1sor_018839 [Riccia sorocarpa]|uniref:PORR domain-containing protein n=1 Tax=Riccia sorocarpa TaxID=122646 RepID=A0ABD3IAY6_9MARC